MSDSTGCNNGVDSWVAITNLGFKERKLDRKGCIKNPAFEKKKLDKERQASDWFFLFSLLITTNVKTKQIVWVQGTTFNLQVLVFVAALIHVKKDYYAQAQSY